MATATEKTRLLAMESPRPSLSSILARPDATCSEDVSMGKFCNIFKKKNAKGPAQDKIKNLVVDITKKEAIPVIADLTIKTNKAPFKGHITIEGIAQRPAFVAAKSAASHISCHFPKHAPGQTVHMVAITYHGTINVALPRDYDGFIVLETAFGHRTQGDLLKDHCKESASRVSDIASITYRVRPEPNVKGKSAGKGLDTEEYNTSKHDYCRLRSYHGLVNIGYIEEMGIFEEDCVKKSSSSCTIA